MILLVLTLDQSSLFFKTFPDLYMIAKNYQIGCTYNSVQIHFPSLSTTNQNGTTNQNNSDKILPLLSKIKN